MSKITIVIGNQKHIHLNPVYRHDEIDSTLEIIRAQLEQSLDASVAQDVFMAKHNLSPDAIVWDFNGDMLYLAMCVRDVYNDDLTDDEYMQEITQMVGDGLLKPTKNMLEFYAYMLHFPESFFLQDHKVDREGKNTFICSAPSWAG